MYVLVLLLKCLECLTCNRLAAYAVLIYDHFLTMDIEIEHIWKRKFSAVTGLYFMTRYYFLIAMTLVLFVFVVPLVSMATCERMLLFVPVGAGTAFTTLPNCIIAMRVYALYERNHKLALALFVFIIAETGVSLWLDLTPSISRIDVFAALGVPQVGNAPAMRFCVPQLSSSLTGIKSTSAQIMQTIFDTAVLLLVLAKARNRGGSGIIAFIVKQGLMYYLLNLATYVAWGLMLIFAPVGSKYVMGGPALGLVCVSVNRLTLHLRGFNTDFDSQRTMAPFSAKRQRRNSWLGTSTLDVRDASETSSDSGVLSTLEMHDLYGPIGPNDSGSDRKFESLNGKGADLSLSM